jgi:hypothetical protein
VPKLLANQRLPFSRFWLPFRGTGENPGIPTIRLYDGILPDPEDEFGKFANPGLQTIAELKQKRCFALLGQPGLGKTIVIEQWIEELLEGADPEDAIIHLTGRGLAAPDEVRYDTIESAEWRRARAAGGEITLVLDGLDEALQRLPVLLTTLQKCLRNEPPDRTRLVLVSRVADWRDSRAEQLFALWPADGRGGAFELCPLRWRDVRLAAEKSGLNADKFQTAVIERRVSWMAGRPKLLLMLLDEFRQHRRLPDSRRELFRRAAMRMCEEHEPERQEVLERSQRAVFPVNELMPVVARISAALLLSGRTYVLWDSDIDAKPSDLNVSELIGGAEPLHEGTVDVDRARILAALDTSHFVACGPGRLGVDHQQMAEFLAAQYLRRCTAPQLRNLLMQRIDSQDYLSPQFRELSAWLAIEHRDFRNDVARREPRLLLEADSVELDDATRGAAIAGLLAQLESGEATDMHMSGTLNRSLRYPGLAKLLRKYIISDSYNIVARRTAIHIARAANCRSLKKDLWRVVSHQAQESVLHSAVLAVAEMASSKDTSKFKDILRHTTDEELKGVALRFLVPKHLPVSSVLKYLTPRDENLFGVYYNALHHYLPDSIREADVLPILKEYERRRTRQDRTGPIRPIVTAAVKFALRHHSNLRMRSACVRFLASELQHHDWRGTWEALRPNDMSVARERQWRRTLLEGFVARAHGRYSSFLRFNLWPTREDFHWVLKKVRAGKGQQLSVWSHLAARVLFEGIPSEALSDVTRTYHAVRAFRQKLPKPRRFGLEETLVRRAHAVERWHEVWRRRTERRKAEEAKGKVTLPEVLEQLRNNKLNWWIAFVRVLDRLRREAKEGHSDTYDLTTTAAWRELPDRDRELARRMASRFLLEVRIPVRKKGFVYHADTAAVRAMVIVHSRILRSPKLRSAVRREWIPAILAESYNGEPDLDALSCLAYKLSPAACVDWARRELHHQAKQGAGFHSFGRFRRCWGRHLTRLFFDFTLSRAAEPRGLAYSFALLRDLAGPDAAALWKECWKRSLKHPTTSRARIITFLGLFGFPEVGWQLAMGRLRKSSRAEQIRVFAKYVHLLSFNFGDWFEKLNDKQLGELYEMLVDLFPPARLRDYKRGGSLRPRDHLGDIQRACLNMLVQRATKSARAELKRLSEIVADENRLMMKWRLRDAVDQRLRTKWVTDQPSPRTVMKIVRTADALRVRDSGELRQAIICSLTRLQAKMRIGEFPKLAEFWSEPSVKPKREREITRVIGGWLQGDLRGDDGVVVDREPQVGFSGNMDIKVEIPASRSPHKSRLRVVIEVKRCMHGDVENACSTQLAEGYLRRKSIADGIYLVAWFDRPDSQVSWSSLEAAEADVHRWADSSSTVDMTIQGFVLDCRWTGMEAPSSLAA